MYIQLIEHIMLEFFIICIVLLILFSIVIVCFVFIDYLILNY